APGAHAVLLHLAFPDFVPAERKERVLLSSAEGHGGDATAVGNCEDHLRGPIVGGDLDPAPRGDELPAFDRVADALRPSVVVPVRDMEVEDPLLVWERAVGCDLVTVHPLRVTLGDGE